MRHRGFSFYVGALCCYQASWSKEYHTEAGLWSIKSFLSILNVSLKLKCDCFEKAKPWKFASKSWAEIKENKDIRKKRSEKIFSVNASFPWNLNTVH